MLLTLLSGSVLRGLAAFAFSTFAITFLGEIVPQAYFSRNALRVTGWFAPVLKVYRVLLFPIENGRPVLPRFSCSADDPFLRQIDASGKKWDKA